MADRERQQSCGGQFQMISISDKLVKRLNNKIDVGYPHSCWNWNAHKDRQGYGKIGINRRGVLAHRIVYLVHHGEIPSNMCVMHTCDNPACCNPSHLKLGTVADNNRDRKNKNRSSRGSKHPTSKLVEKNVLEIFNSYEPAKDLAVKYDVSKSTIYGIKNGFNWNWLTKVKLDD